MSSAPFPVSIVPPGRLTVDGVALRICASFPASAGVLRTRALEERTAEPWELDAFSVRPWLAPVVHDPVRVSPSKLLRIAWSVAPLVRFAENEARSIPSTRCALVALVALVAFVALVALVAFGAFVALVAEGTLPRLASFTLAPAIVLFASRLPVSVPFLMRLPGIVFFLIDEPLMRLVAAKLDPASASDRATVATTIAGDGRRKRPQSMCPPRVGQGRESPQRAAILRGPAAPAPPAFRRETGTAVGPGDS